MLCGDTNCDERLRRDTSFGVQFEYRIKPTAETRPMNHEEWGKYAKRTVRSKLNGSESLILSRSRQEILVGTVYHTFFEMAENYTKPNGDPLTVTVDTDSEDWPQ